MEKLGFKFCYKKAIFDKKNILYKYTDEHREILWGHTILELIC